ncbi:hypothetical protein VAE151_560816 [Vibrio aestuarianus]|uniref:Uncharacterized protein n=1 Tax=Vibrio aestuarianus TaxID=28171 RepID=A0ABM9FTS5_9VIBR|nr:hypothetical protein VAE308_1051460 [Vibrio aestuarianus]CAH8222796.1 hypothetical protein VAE151_560816 [Vibrio aestuarianus]CAH8239456.1 hypothetical protein VAE063_950815 [Vibrio aestuarianus]
MLSIMFLFFIPRIAFANITFSNIFLPQLNACITIFYIYICTGNT